MNKMPTPYSNVHYDMLWNGRSMGTLDLARNARYVLRSIRRYISYPAMQGMADCMVMVRDELIEAKIIDKSVPPMFLANAVVSHIQAIKAGSQAPFGYFHQMINAEGEPNGVWLGCPSRKATEQAYVEGETCSEIVPLYASPSNEVAELRRKLAIATKALQTVANWDLPSTGEMWGHGNPLSYEAKHGYNGVRDFLKDVASKALADVELPKGHLPHMRVANVIKDDAVALLEANDGVLVPICFTTATTATSPEMPVLPEKLMKHPNKDMLVTESALQQEKEQIEAYAITIYNTWALAKMYPWVPGGNSHKQEEARRAALKVFQERKGVK